MRLEAAFCTHTGHRRNNNEDSLLVDDHLAIFAVADGMGGHRGGEVASSTAIEALRASVANGNALPDAVNSANRAVWDRSLRDRSLVGMGTTMTVLQPVSEGRVLIAHVGDSRAYLLRAGELEMLTEDHSLVGELFREGAITKEQADVHPQRAIITRAVGLEPDVEVATYSITVAVGDRLLICSDGLTDMLRESDIVRIANVDSSAEVAASELVDAANDAGGDDNITVVVVDVADVDASAISEPAFADSATLLQHEVAVPAPRPATQTIPAAATLPRRTIGRRVLSVLPVLIPTLLIIGVAFATLGWYARQTYFATLDGGEIIVKRGRPGGFLGWDPTLDSRTSLNVADLRQAERADFADGVGIEGSKSRVDAYIERLTAATTTTTKPSVRPSTTTTTSRPRSTTTTRRPPSTRTSNTRTSTTTATPTNPNQP